MYCFRYDGSISSILKDRNPRLSVIPQNHSQHDFIPSKSGVGPLLARKGVYHAYPVAFGNHTNMVTRRSIGNPLFSTTRRPAATEHLPGGGWRFQKSTEESSDQPYIELPTVFMLILARLGNEGVKVMHGLSLKWERTFSNRVLDTEFPNESPFFYRG